jgi:hypothetical protein
MEGVFAEVIDSRLESFVAQCWQWNVMPNFGSLVEVTNKETIFFGVVVGIKTGSSDPVRQAFVYKKTEEELMAEQPQIFEFLQTTFDVYILGYKTSKNCKVFYVIPPRPCTIHSFVRCASVDIFCNFFSKSDFLYVLFSLQGNVAVIDDVLLAILKNLRLNGKLTKDFLDNLYQVFSLLTSSDYKRVKIFLRRLEEILWLPEQDSNLRPND